MSPADDRATVAALSGIVHAYGLDETFREEFHASPAAALASRHLDFEPAPGVTFGTLCESVPPGGRAALIFALHQAVHVAPVLLDDAGDPSGTSSPDPGAVDVPPSIPDDPAWALASIPVPADYPDQLAAVIYRESLRRFGPRPPAPGPEGKGLG
ncbi:MAG: hypothetical protein QG622_2696 [Actinomycetota bacterium]|nr:hypothetical protein [Actinomycetota bacterium]